MGWSHAVNLFQTIVKSLVLRGPGVVPEIVVSDARVMPSLRRSAVFTYVDNIIALTSERGRSAELQCGIRGAPRDRGLLVHDEQYGEDRSSALGWDMHWKEGGIRPEGQRAWRLWLALDHALSRKEVCGRQLMRVLGDYVFHGRLQKENTVSRAR